MIQYRTINGMTPECYWAFAAGYSAGKRNQALEMARFFKGTDKPFKHEVSVARSAHLAFKRARVNMREAQSLAVAS